MANIEDVFRVHVLGVGSCFSYKYNTVSLGIQTGNRLILVETPGHPAKIFYDYNKKMKSMIRSRKDNTLDIVTLENAQDLIVTHDHADHSSGLEDIAFYNMYVKNPSIMDGAPKPRLYGTLPVISDLTHSLQRKLEGVDNLHPKTLKDFFDIKLVDEVFPASIGDAKLDVWRTMHEMRGFAVKITYRNRCIAYSGDTSFDTSIMDFLKSADMLIHECNGITAGGHTIPEQLSDWLRTSGYKGAFYTCHYKDTALSRKYGLNPLMEGRYYNVKSALPDSKKNR